MLRITSEVAVEESALAEFCRRWKIRQLAVFGSARRPDFRADSDIDLLVTFAPEADWGLFDHVTMESELSDLIGRRVDLISRKAVEASSNWIRRQAILTTAEPLFDAEGGHRDA
jgi:predicted nucleotidyltransferase